MKVLVVDDDRDFAGALCTLLGGGGFHTRTTASGSGAMALARSWRPDVVLLDVVLPDTDGFSVCRALRADSPAGIIMLSGLSDEADRVAGLEVGADDYLTKPCSPRELAARLRAVHRRVNGRGSGSDRLISRDLVLVPSTQKVWLRGRRLRLTAKESELLQTFLSRPGQALTREALYERVWPGASPDRSRTLDAHIRSLRTQIEDEPSRPRRIVTLRGVGYRFEG